MPARKKITIQLAQLSQDKCWYFYIKAGQRHDCYQQAIQINQQGIKCDRENKRANA